MSPQNKTTRNSGGDGSDRLRPLRIPLPLDEALRGAMGVPPPANDDEDGDPEQDDEDEPRPKGGAKPGRDGGGG